MSCGEVARLLQSYLDGELDAATTVALRAHLRDCVRCGLEAATYQRIKAVLAERGRGDDDDTLGRLHRFAAQLVAQGPGSPARG